MYSSILFPVDLAHDGSWSAVLPVVRQLATASGASVHVVTVIPEVRGTAAAEFFPPDFEQRVFDKARAQLEAFIATHFGDLADVHGHVETGKPYKRIVAAAEQLGCDLIVMTSHKPEPIDILISPTADHVVRHSKVSVLIVRG